MSVIVERIINKPIDSNCYVIYESNLGSCIVVDPGTKDCNDLIKFLEQNSLSPTYVIITHEHFDHIWGVGLLREKYNCKLICSVECNMKISNPKLNLSIFYDQIGFNVESAEILIEDNKKCLSLNKNEVFFLKTPGHSEGSISFFIGDKLFCGDMMIKHLNTVTKLPGGNKEHLKESLNWIYLNFDEMDTVVYAGHGDVFILNEFKS